ncbi:MAG: YbaK/EbsC family protein [Bacteroidota bacterium]
MPLQKLKKFLDENNVKYTTISHSKAYTAQQVAHSAHISGKDMAKTVMVLIEGKMAMVVVPAHRHVHFKTLKETLGIEDITLANEMEFQTFFPACEVGTMPPFGNLYDMEVFVDKSLAKDHLIAFNAGSHTELVQMAYEDFENLVKPQLIECVVKKAAA